jgi:hypothetical protein
MQTERYCISIGFMSSTRLSSFIVAAIASCTADHLSAENLPQIRPAMIGSGPGSLVNLIDTQALFQKGQRDGWVMFDCSVAADGDASASDFFTASPNSNLLREEVRKRVRQTRFIPAVYNHKRTWSWFAGTVLFVVKDGRPHLRIYANQDLDVIKSGTDFVAPQMIDVPTHYYMNFPKVPTAAVRDDAAGVVKVRHSVDANGKSTNVEVVSEPAGSQTGDFLKKALPRLDFTPGYRNGRPTATTYTFTWWFGRVVGR